MKSNNKKNYYFTSESVSCGHPDKLCDTVVDAIKDWVLSHDHQARIALEALVTTNTLILAGEVTTSAEVPYEKIIRDTIKEIGYIHPEDGFSYDTVNIDIKVHEQSSDIALGTNEEVGGAGDQGIIFGYANNETEECYPLAGIIARDLASLAQVISTEGVIQFRPDVKSQVTVQYKGDELKIDTIVMAVSHSTDLSLEELKAKVICEVIKPVLKYYGYSLSDVRKIIINGTGAFSIYGPASDTGVTGRKLAVDQYQGYSRIGGGTMQGKDPTKVDNASALMARYIAKTLVKAGLADECQVQLAYAIGVPEPVSINVDCKGTVHKYPVGLIKKAVKNLFDCTPKGIIDKFSLRCPEGWCYKECSANGWFANKSQLTPWEKDDMVDSLLAECERLEQERVLHKNVKLWCN